MMDEPITFDPAGTITIRLDDTHVLARPKMGQWRFFRRRFDQAIAERRERAQDLSRQVQELIDRTPKPHDDTNPEYVALLDSDEYQKLVSEISEETRKLAENPLYELTIPWLAEVFAQLSDPPMPADPDEWPAWLSNPTLPEQFLRHWQSVPKVSGPNPPG